MAKKAGGKLAAGLGLAALAASAATGYYFYGKDGKQHRNQAKTKVKGWSSNAKGEMLKQIKGMKQVSKKAYDQAVRDVMAKYKQARNIDPKELAALAVELKGHWDDISKNLAKLGAKPVKGAAASHSKKARR